MGRLGTVEAIGYQAVYQLPVYQSTTSLSIGSQLAAPALLLFPGHLSLFQYTTHMTDLTNKTVLITSGPTRERIDPVRYISNFSSGKQGHAIAHAFAKAGAKVHLVSGPVAIDNPEGVNVTKVETAQEMYKACQKLLPIDIAICVAAVSDWKVKRFSEYKMKKDDSEESLTLEMVKNPDILAFLSQHASLRPELVVGFAAETNDVEFHAQEKLAKKQCDWLLANEISEESSPFGADQNKVYFLSGENGEWWEEMSKAEVAEKLVGLVLGG